LQIIVFNEFKVKTAACPSAALSAYHDGIRFRINN
jgi:hypothetical protein